MKRLLLFSFIAASLSFMSSTAEAAGSGSSGASAPGIGGPARLLDFWTFESEDDGTQYVCMFGDAQRCTFQK